jgi:hypothetical protein
MARAPSAALAAAYAGTMEIPGFKEKEDADKQGYC